MAATFHLDLVLKAHSGDAERVDRRSRPPLFLDYPRLTIGLSPQPEVLCGLVAKPGLRVVVVLACKWMFIASITLVREAYHSRNYGLSVHSG